MILVAGLTPAWQQIVLLERLVVGEVNRAREVHWCASGKVLNVGLALHHLGGAARTLVLGGGAGQEAIERELAALVMPRRWVLSQAATRVCTTILDAAQGATTELVQNAAAPLPRDIEAFRQAFAEEARAADHVVLTGSLPAGTPGGFYRDLLRHTSARPILDIRGPELLASLEARPLLVKPNREELAHTLGRELATDEEVVAGMAELRQGGAEWVVVTQGVRPAWISGPEGFYLLQPPAVAAINPIGCGDCLAAGVAWGLDQGRPMLDALCLGFAAAAENALTLLPARLDPARVTDMARRLSPFRIGS